MSRENNHSAVSGGWQRARWLPYEQFTWLLEWHKMAAWLWLNAGLSSGQTSCGCNKGGMIDLSVMCFIANEFSEYLQLELPSWGMSAIQSCTYYQSLIGDTLNCYMFFVYDLIAVTLTSSSLGIWFSLMCIIKNSSMHYVDSVWCVNDV